ncbi:MAG: ABC transporter permease [Methylotenera sp.]|nr:ABC transporter permease [Oligoflexia bacterium]
MLFLALRHLLSRKRQSVLTLTGIVLGTAAYVAISGMMLGFQTFIVDQLVNNDAHIRISAREEPIEPHSLDEDFFGPEALVDWKAAPSGRRDNAYILSPRFWTERMDRMPEVAAYSQQLVTQVIVTRAKVAKAARLIGSDPARQAQVANIKNYMIKGQFTDIGIGGNRIVMGDGLLKQLGASVPGTVYLSVGKGQTQPFKVIGSFHLGVKALDDSTLFGALPDVQKLNGTPSRISDIAVRLHDVEGARELATSWNILSQEKVQSWDQANEGIMSVFTTQDIVRNSMTISILIVAGFGIYNILNMAVTHKRREIAILRSMGYESSDIVALFLTQGIILGVLGGIIGCLLGYGVCEIMARIPVADRGLGGNHMIIVFFPGIYVRGFIIAFSSASIASFLPARAAGRLSPIDIIRSENS